MNAAEYGNVVYFNLQEDVSANTNTIVIRDPSWVTTEVAATLGTTTLVTPSDGTWTANEWVSYTIADGDIDIHGIWAFRAVSVYSASKKLKTDWINHEVER